MFYLGAAIGAVFGAAAVHAIRGFRARAQATVAENEAARALEDAQRDIRAMRKEAEVQIKADTLKAREEFEQSTASRKAELAAVEERVTQRENNLDRKVTMLDRKEQNLDRRLDEVEAQSKEIVQTRNKLANEEAGLGKRLERLAGMSREEARRELLAGTEQEVSAEMAGLVRKLHDAARDKATRDAQRIVAYAVQRCAVSHAGEMMTCSVSLPGNDMKGRIIGRDGRNIRSIEAATGANILIDDTPEAVVISGFDPLRREIARQTLERLIADGRIHPARIEEIVEKVREEMEETTRSVGEDAAHKAGVQGVETDVLRTLGRLRFRTSYSQNMLQHSIEVAALMGGMAGELGLDVALARRVGLFHDIGKALNHEAEGGHAMTGAEFLRRHGETPIVVNAVAAHHEDVAAESLYPVLASAADAISSSRVGARSETSEVYVKRLEKLETIPSEFEGVEKCYAIQAGREVRVIVDPGKVDEAEALLMARAISKRIESELQYPGQVRVTLIRETRCVEYAR